MAISKNSKMLQISLPKEMHDSMEVMCKVLSKELGQHITKRMLIMHIYEHWCQELAEKVNKLKEEKENA